MLYKHLPLLPIVLPLTGAVIALLLSRSRSLQALWTLATMLTALACST